MEIGQVRKCITSMAALEDTVDLSFSDQNTLYASHGLHSFAAKCPPQLAKWVIERFSEPGGVVLDPMVGSGTTLAEARMLGRNALGLDIDPWARLLSVVKSTPVEPTRLREASKRLLERLDADYLRLEQSNDSCLPADLKERCQLPKIERLDYWFLPTVAAELALLKYHILTSSEDRDIRDFFLVVFSSLILARTSVANARDIVHSRHHYRAHESPPDVRQRFRQRLRTMTRMMTDFWKACHAAPRQDVEVKIIGNDARAIPLPPSSVNLIFTSPPYCNALDYVRAHALTVAWLQDVLDISQPEYTLLGREYIGTERAMKSADSLKGILPPDVPLLADIVRRIRAIDQQKGNVVTKYFADMWTVFQEMGRVLKPDQHLVLVVCPSHIRKVEVPTHKAFGKMTERMTLDQGYRLTQVACVERVIDDRRRLLPYMRKAFGKRMRTEYVMIYKKTLQ
jgi:DNA modification methylase